MNVPTSGGTPDQSVAPVTGADRAPAEQPIEQSSPAFHPEAIDHAPDQNVKTPDEILAPPPPEGPGKWDVFMAKLGLAAIDSPTATIGRQLMEPTGTSDFAMAKGGEVPDYFTPAKPKLSPEEANTLYPGMPKPFDEPIDPDTAGRIAAVQKRRQDLMNIIAQGPTIGKGLDALVGAAAGGLAAVPTLNPYAIGAAAIGGAAFGAYGGGESVVVGVADPINLALMVSTGGLGEGGVLWKNLATNAASQGLSIPQRIKEQQNVNLKDEAINVVGGALGGTALHVATKLAFGGYGRPQAYEQAQRYARQAPPDVQQKMLETAVAQHEAGANVDMSAATFEMQARSAGETADGVKTYEFKPVNHPSERTQYTATSAEHGVPIQLEDFGDGIYMTDNGQAASNIVSAPDSPHTGSVHEMHVDPGAKILDLEEPLPKTLADQASAELAKQGIGEDLVSRQQIEGMKARDVMEMMRGIPVNPGEPSALDVIQARLKAEGYDGLKWVHEDMGLQQNRSMMFDSKHVTPGEEFKANKDTTPRMSPEQSQAVAEQINDPQNQRDYSPEIEKKVAQDQAQQQPTRDEDHERAVQIFDDHMKWLKDLAKENPHLLEDPEYKALLHEEAQAKQEERVMTDLADCMIKEST